MKNTPTIKQPPTKKKKKKKKKKKLTNENLCMQVLYLKFVGIG